MTEKLVTVYVSDDGLKEFTNKDSCLKYEKSGEMVTLVNEFLKNSVEGYYVLKSRYYEDSDALEVVIVDELGHCPREDFNVNFSAWNKLELSILNEFDCHLDTPSSYWGQ